MHVNWIQKDAILVLEKGEKIIESLTQFSKEHNLKGAFFSGIGALNEVELGAYDIHNKSYIRKIFNDMAYELISMNGNLTLKDKAPYIHIHAMLGDHHFQTFGGHLFEAIVAVTAEIKVNTFDSYSIRKHSEEIGLGLICEFMD